MTKLITNTPPVINSTAPEEYCFIDKSIHKKNKENAVREAEKCPEFDEYRKSIPREYSDYETYLKKAAFCQVKGETDQ